MLRQRQDVPSLKLFVPLAGASGEPLASLDCRRWPYCTTYAHALAFDLRTDGCTLAPHMLLRE
jgi:hypothetical protein